jgi:hypothetical protein
MIPRTGYFLIGGAALLSSAICLLAFSGTAQTSALRTTKMTRPYERIENRASLVDANNLASIQALADEVFLVPRAYPRMPDVVAGAVKARLVQAEAKYMHGEGPGVQEQEVVTLLNDLATRFGAPEYAKTSLAQVRVMRMTLLLSAPVFMGRGMMPDHARLGDSVNTTMSPLQAAHLVGGMIDQKMLNPDFQVAPAEWDSNRYESALAKIQQIRDMKLSGQLQTTMDAMVRDNPKRLEMRQLLSREFSFLTLNDASALINEAFATLKIEN